MTETPSNSTLPESSTRMSVEEKFEKVLEVLSDFCTAIEAECIRIKRRIREIVERELGLDEKVFEILHWEKKQGERLGDFEVAAKDKNDFDAWNHAYQILKVNNATIKNHFGWKDWKYYYWLFDGYPGLIFRKKRGQRVQKNASCPA